MSATSYAFKLITRNPWILFLTAGICVVLLLISLAVVFYYGLVTALMFLGISSLALALMHKLNVIDLSEQPLWFIIPPVLAVVGYYTSIALDTSNNPHISYLNGGANLDLKYAKWDGSWNIQTVDTTGSVGYYTSIALDTSNNPHISYVDFTNGYLKYAKWTGSWNIQTVDTTGGINYFTSIALDTSNNPHISYHDQTNHDLKYAGWDGSWTIQTVDSTGWVGDHNAIAVDSSNNLHISYVDYLDGDLKYAKGTQPNASPTPTPTPSPSPTITPTRPPYVGGTYITLNTNQLPTIILIAALTTAIATTYLAVKTLKKQKNN